MANRKISELPPASLPLSGTEIFPLVQGGITKQSTVLVPVLTPQMFGAVGNGATNDTAAITRAFSAASSSKLPLLVTGGLIYAVDSVPLVSNLTVLGDGLTTFKLRDSAVGSMFVWAPNATTDNVHFSNLILDGNFAGQPGAPHNLIHGLFISASDTSIITNSEFIGLSIANVDGCAFSSLNGALDTIYTDCLFRDITVFHHTQSAFAVQVIRDVFEHIRIDNASNTNVPPSGQGGAYGMGLKGSDTTVRDVRISLTTTLQGATDKVGFALTASANTVGNNLIDGVDVDSGGAAHNFAFTIDTGFGNTLNNLTSRNGAWNCDFEIFNQVALRGSNWHSLNVEGSDVGLIIDGCSGVQIHGYKLDGATTADAIRINSFVYGGNDDIEINGYSISGAAEGLRMGQGTLGNSTNLRFISGYMSCSTPPGDFPITMDGTSSITDLIVDNLIINAPTATDWASLNNLHNAYLDNVMLQGSTPTTTQQTGCTAVVIK